MVCSKIGLDFFSFSEKSFYINFADLCLKVGLELTQMVFFSGIVLFGFWTKISPIGVFKSDALNFPDVFLERQ